MIVQDNKWHMRFLTLAEGISAWSKDTTKVGCVIVGPTREIRATGYNGFPRGVQHTPERDQRPLKYLFSSHAEENAICHAARTGVSLEGCCAYVGLHPCAACARMLIQSGVETIVTRAPDFNLPTWGEGFKRAVEMCHESKTQLLYL